MHQHLLQLAVNHCRSLRRLGFRINTTTQDLPAARLLKLVDNNRQTLRSVDGDMQNPVSKLQALVRCPNIEKLDVDCGEGPLPDALINAITARNLPQLRKLQLGGADEPSNKLMKQYVEVLSQRTHDWFCCF